jgi:hypothetical protein
MGNLIPYQTILYRTENEIVYARYADAPYNTLPEWIVGYPLEKLEQLKKAAE